MKIENNSIEILIKNLSKVKQFISPHKQKIYSKSALQMIQILKTTQNFSENNQNQEILFLIIMIKIIPIDQDYLKLATPIEA